MVYDTGLRLQAEFLNPLFKADNGKGFYLADRMVEAAQGRIKTPIPLQAPHQIREFVEKGAEMGARIYKEVYPYARSLNGR